MSQSLPNDFPIDPTVTSGDALADILNRQNAAINTSNAGATPPTVTFPGMQWLDTSVNPPVLRIRNAANNAWGVIPVTGDASGAGAPFLLPDGTIAAPALAFASEAGLGMYRVGAGNLGWATGGQYVGGVSASATDTYLRLYPRAAGSANLQLCAAAATAANTDVFSIAKRADGTHFIAYGIGTGTAKPMFFDGAPAYTFSGPVLATKLSIEDGRTDWLQDANNVYFRMTPVWYWLFAKASGNFVWTRGNGVAATTFAANGDFFAGGNVYGGAGTNIGLVNSDSFPYVRFTANGWRWQFDNSVGNLSYWNHVNQELTRFTPSGDAGKISGGTAWFVLSDIRAKENVRDYTEGLDAVLSLRPRIYDRTDTGEKDVVGVVADEAEQGFPRLIKRNRDKIGLVEYDDVATLHIDPLYWALVNSIKTFDARLRALEDHH